MRTRAISPSSTVIDWAGSNCFTQILLRGAQSLLSRDKANTKNRCGIESLTREDGGDGTVKERHRWLRDALTDKNLRAKDVAKEWGCTDGVVSRFIKTGDPELTWERAGVLSRMLGMDMNELQIQIASRPQPAAAVAKTNSGPSEEAPTSVETALEAVRVAVERARVAMPGYRISVRIELEGDV